MPNRIPIQVDDPDDLLNTGEYGAGAVIRLQTSATEAGVYADVTGTGSTPTIALVAGTTSYTGRDPNGTSTSWYRTRYENSGATRVSDWTTSFLAGALTAYATLEDLLELTPEATTLSDNLLTDLLVRASAHIDARCGRDFYRHPQVTGTEIRYFDGDGTDVLRVRERIVSISTLETGDGTTFSTVTAGTYYLLPYNLAPGESYAAIYSETAFPEGRRTVRITGAFGFSEVPEIIRSGTLALARLMLGTVLTASGSAMGGAEYGPVPVPALLPLDTYRAIEWGKVRVVG